MVFDGVLASHVLLMCGLPASGKTTTAARLHAYGGGVLIRSCDVYRSLGISLPDWVRRTRGFTANVAEYERVRDGAYAEMARRLEHALVSAREPVIVDAVHGERGKRRDVYDSCRALGRTPVLVWCRCDDWEEIRRRFRRRERRESEPENEASDLAVFRHIAGLWEEPVDDPAVVPIVAYDTLRDDLRPVRGDAAPAVGFIRAALAAQPLPAARLA
ncbi:MAG: AAA family ATPase [Candidatus Rokubacteria bacterium]|nr:AAA family ATPase [Candidatus Rokubacteria bacterium]